MVKVTEVLEFLEEHMDVGHIEKVKADIKKTLKFEQNTKIPLRIDFPIEIFKGYPYEETYLDMEKMMVYELLPACNAVQIKDHTVPMIRANYGVGTLASLFGLNCRIVNGNLPWVDHVENTDEIKKIISNGVPELRAGLGARVFDTQVYYNEQLSHYPKCQKYIPVYHPDLQGPFDIAHLIWGPDIYYALYDDPEIVHELLGLVTDTYIKFIKELKKTINDEEDGYNFHWGTLYAGRIVLRDDSPVNLSREMYEEFVKPYDERILKEFGSGSIHYCGRADQWVFEMMESEGLEAMNFGQPPKLVFGFEFLAKIYPRMKQKNIANAGYFIDNKLLAEIKNSDYTTGVTYLTHAENREEALELLALFEW